MSEIPAFAVYDMEWTPDLQVQFIGYYDGIEFRGFTDLDDFTAFLLTRPAKVVYAHSGGSYDVLFMLRPLIDAGVDMRGFFSGVALVGLTVSTPNGQITLADSLFLIQSSVAKLGEWVGLPKQDLDHTVKHPTHVYEPYCFRDCEIVYLAIDRFSSAVNELGVTMRLTVGATAIALAKHYGGVFPMHGAADRHLTPAYFGGRTEDVLKGKHHNVFNYDINSAYPWAMTRTIPGAFLGTTKKEPKPPYFVKARNIRLSGGHGPLPVRTPQGLYYPTGVIPEGVISDAEAQLTDGFEPDVYYSFAENHNLSVLVEKLYALRQEGGASSLAYKILANSIYGKFAEKPLKDGLLVGPDSPTGTMLMPGVYRVEKYVHVAHRNIATAAYITSLVRVKLFGYLDSETIYMDTDGFWTTKERTGECNNELGGIKLEKQADNLHILQPKVYKYGPMTAEDGSEYDAVRAKGYRHLNSEQFDDLAAGGRVRLEPTMHRVKGMLRRGLLTPQLREVEKRMHHHKPKRRPDGTPWDYEEIGAFGTNG